MQVECRGNMFTMPRRRRFKPRIDCEAILGKLSSYSSLYHYVYNPPQTPPFEKEGLVVSLSAYLTGGENYPNRHSSLRRTINSAQIEKLRDRRSSLKEVDAYYSMYLWLCH